MKGQKIYVEIAGGCYQNAANLPDGWIIEVIDWDNLLGNEADTRAEWNRFDSTAQGHIKETYPVEFKIIMGRLQTPTSN